MYVFHYSSNFIKSLPPCLCFSLLYWHLLITIPYSLTLVGFWGKAGCVKVQVCLLWTSPCYRLSPWLAKQNIFAGIRARGSANDNDRESRGRTFVTPKFVFFWSKMERAGGPSLLYPLPSFQSYICCLSRTLFCTSSLCYWQKFASVDCVLQLHFKLYSKFKCYNTNLINTLQLVINTLEPGKEFCIATSPF